MKTDAFRPVTLPGEIKSRSSKQCVGFSSCFVDTVRNQSHVFPSYHQHDPDLCVDDAMPYDLLFDDQMAQRTSGFECSFASGFDVNAKSAMGKSCIGRRGSVAKTCSAMPCTRHSGVVANCPGLMASRLIKNRSDRVHSFAGTPDSSRQSVGLNGRMRQKTWRMRHHHRSGIFAPSPSSDIITFHFSSHCMIANRTWPTSFTSFGYMHSRCTLNILPNVLLL